MESEYPVLARSSCMHRFRFSGWGVVFYKRYSTQKLKILCHFGYEFRKLRE